MQGLRPMPLGEVKRVTYFWAMLVAIPSLSLVWWLRLEDPFIRFLYPLLALLCGFWAWRVRARAGLEGIEREVIAGVGVFFGLKFIYNLYFSNLTTNWAEMESSYWALAYVMVLVYIVFTPRQGLMVGLAMVVLTLALGLFRLGGGFSSGNLLEELLAFVRSEVRLLAMVGLLYLLATVKDRLTQMNRQVEEMHTLARTDPLTGLPNRLALSEYLEGESHQAHGLYVVLLDLDHFKQINDRYGHNVGDGVLKEVGRRLRSSLRKGDVLGRWGGEEFMIIMRGDSQHDVLAAVERLREDVAFWPFDGVGAVSASFGVAEGHMGDSIHSLLDRADKALYQAKHLGRNRVEFSLA
jgi:diguanylate cyclase (GGDEF)-like protein